MLHSFPVQICRRPPASLSFVLLICPLLGRVLPAEAAVTNNTIAMPFPLKLLPYRNATHFHVARPHATSPHSVTWCSLAAVLQAQQSHAARRTVTPAYHEKLPGVIFVGNRPFPASKVSARRRIPHQPLWTIGW